MNWRNIEMKYNRIQVFEAVQNTHSSKCFKCYIVLFTERFLSRYFFDSYFCIPEHTGWLASEI